MNDTRSAAERLRTLTYHGQGVWRMPSGFGLDEEDVNELRTEVAAAYLDEHPADDGEAVTEEWLLAVGFQKHEWHPSKVTFVRADALDIGLWNVDDGWKAMVLMSEHSASCIRRGLRTRGEVRRLCQCLGIELTKEAT
jgi:hypothetical protein